jgi:WD40 repeat protein
MHLYFSPNGERLALALLSPSDRQKEINLTVWDPRTGRQLPPPQGLRTPEVLLNGYGHFLKLLPKFSPDGRLLVYGCGKDVSTWDTTTGKPRRTFRGHAQEVVGCFVTAGGTRLLSVEGTGVLREWDLGPQREAVVAVEPVGPPVQGPLYYTFSEDGSRMAMEIALPGEPGAPVPPGVSPPVGFQLWDATTGKALKLLALPPRDPGPGNRFNLKNTLALNADGRRVVLLRDCSIQGRYQDEKTPEPDLRSGAPIGGPSCSTKNYTPR